MAHLGNLTVFDHKISEWSIFKGRVTQFLKINSVLEENKSGILLTYLTDETYRLVRNLAHPSELESLSFSRLVELLDSHFKKRECTFADKANFFGASRGPGEPIGEWVARLRGLASYCDFGAALETNLRDRFVLGLGPGLERDRLFEQKPSTLTLTQAIDLAEQAACVKQAKAIMSIGEVTLPVKEEPVYRAKFTSQAARGGKAPVPAGYGASGASSVVQLCSVCGMKNHSSDKCRFKGYKCLKCGLKGHLKKVCKLKNMCVYHNAEEKCVENNSKNCCEECQNYNIRSLKPLISLIGKMSYLAGGMAITVRGRQASRNEAPILVVAPHSSFLDSCIVYATEMSSVIVRKESMDNYVGKLINYTQPVYVWRDDPNSRQNTIKEIIERATSKEDWPQILIFPEGTCTNRSCLITFKSGGFYPGVPVQPVTIRYPNAKDTVTWTWEGPGALKLLWLTLTQIHSSCEIEFLPVYYPNEQEKRDPKLYARNVRDVMAKALGVPVLDYTYDDCRFIAKAKHLGIPGAPAVREVQELRAALGLEKTQMELRITSDVLQGLTRWLTPEDFALRLGVPLDPRLQRLYDIFVQRPIGLLYFPDYLMCAAFLSLQHAPLSQVLAYAFKLFDSVQRGQLNPAQFEEAATRCLGLCPEDAQTTFLQADMDAKGYITYDEFISFALKRPEFSFLFATDTSHNKPKSQ